MQDIIAWLNATALHTFIVSNSWVWPSLEILHFIGLCLLFGSLLIVDLRVIGVAPNIPLRLVDKFIVITLLGFTLNLTTGMVFLVGDPGRYFINIAFKIKMVLILIAGLNAIYFTLRVRPHIKRGIEGIALGSAPKYVAGLSLTLWTSVIVLGRLIPYVEQ